MKSTLVWATNIAPPYRRPVWNHLSRMCSFEVWLLAANEFNRRWEAVPDPGYEQRLLPTYQFVRGEESFYLLDGRRFRSHVGEPQIDAIILPSWQNPATWQLLQWSRRRDIRTIAFNESTLASRRYSASAATWARDRFYSSVDHVITVSPASTEAVLASGVDRARITETANAVDVDAFRHGDCSEAPPPHRYLYCGSLIERKQPEVAIRAFAQLSDRPLLEIVGDGPLTPRVQALTSELGVADRVVMHGYLHPDEAAAVFRRCHTLVLPSTQEVHGLVVQEALASGMHVVVSASAGVASLLPGIPTAWTVAPEVGRVAAAMDASRLAWDGRPFDPTIVNRFRPETMSSSILAAAHRAVAHLA